MRRRALAVAVVVVVVVVAGAVGAWFGGHLPAPVQPPAGVTVPIAPGAPERVETVAPPSDSESGEDVGATVGGSGSVLTPDGRTLASVGTDGSVSTLDTTTLAARAYRVGTPPEVNANISDYAQSRHGLTLTPDGRTAYATDGWGRTLHVVDLVSGAVRASIPVPTIPTAVALVGPTLVVGDATGAITMLDAASDRPIGFHDVAADAIAELVATPDGHHVIAVAASTSSYPPSTVFDVDLTNPAAPTVPFDWPVQHPRDLLGSTTVVSPDGGRAYVVSAPPPGARSFDGDTGGGVMALDLRTGHAMDTIPGPGAQVVALSPDGRHLYIGRSVEFIHAHVISPTSVVDTHDTGPGFGLIGSLTTTGSSSPSTLLAAPDGRRLYGGGRTVVALRGP